MTFVLPTPDVCECGGASTVVNVRVQAGHRIGVRSGWLIRRRECLRCGARWSTWESAILHPRRLRRYLQGRLADPQAVLLSLIDPMTVAPSPSRGDT